jgi:lipopolysaccharide export system protein LptA
VIAQALFRRCRAALAIALTLALASPATAATAVGINADRDQPINYSADTGDVNYQTKVGALTGNVVITQGTLTIRADKITFRQNADNSMSATAIGNPVSFRQKRDGTDEFYEGFAQRAEYDGSKQLLELFDRALLKRGQDEIRSNYISYNASTEEFKAEGRAATTTASGTKPPADDGRVRGVFQPKSGEGKDGGLLPRPGGDGKDAAKAKDAKAPAKDGKAVAKPAEPLPLKPSGELAPKAAK